VLWWSHSSLDTERKASEIGSAQESVERAEIA
jgi:hypothetical protein